MNRTILSALGVLALAGGAFAQESKPLGLAVRMGIFMPSDSAAKGEGKTWWTGGAEFKFRDLNVGQMDSNYQAALSVSLDYHGRGNYQSTPVLVNYVGRVNQMFYSAGIGVSFTRMPEGEGTVDKTRLAYQLGVGYDFQQGQSPLFVEAKYFGNAKSALNGLSLYVGIRL